MYYQIHAPLAKLVDALDLGSSSLRCIGSSPIWGTNCQVVKSVRMADTPTRLVGAEYETDVRIWVDHKAGYFVQHRIAA